MKNTTRQRAERVEVRRSREKILAAAEMLFANGAAEPTMSSLASVAEVSSAALYRRFPTMDAVVIALHDRLMQHFQKVATAALRQKTGWEAIVTTLTGIAHAIGEHPAIPVVYRRMARMDEGYRLGPQWDESLKAMARRAHEENTLRADVDINDVTMAAFRIGEYGFLPEPDRSRVIDRQLAIVIDGLRASAAITPVRGQGISTDQVNELIHTQAQRHERPLSDNSTP